MKKNLLSAAVAAGLAVSYGAQAAIEEVVVTAQKRAQSAQDIGITMTAMGEDELKNLGVLEASALTEFVPNMELAKSGDSGIPIFVLRGVGLQDYNTNNTPTTAVVVDDVYQPYGVYTAFSMFDTERVEVLKGPQGGLYGRNSTGGAINMVSKKPSFEQIEGDLEANIGNYGTTNLRGGISVPLSDTLAARLAVQSENSQGYYENTYLNTDQGGADKQQARLTLSFQPTDTLSADLRVTYGSDESEVGIPEHEGIYASPNGGGFGPTGLTDGAGNPLPDINSGFAPCSSVVATGIPDSSCVNNGGFAPDGALVGQEDRVRNNNDEFNSNSLNIKWDVGAVTLDSITNYSTLSFYHTNGAGSVGLGVDEVNRAAWEQAAADSNRTIDFNNQYVTNYNSEMESFSQEFRVSSNETDGFSWMAGITYAKDNIDELRSCSFGAALYADWLAFPGCGTMPYTQETEATSAYGQLALDLSDALTLTVDGRMTNETKDYVGSVMVNDGAWAAYAWGLVPDFATGYAVFGDGPITLASGTPGTYDETTPSWKVNMDWKANDDVLVYASVGESFKSGGFFGGFFFDAAAVESYKPETNLAVEVGFKSTLADGNVQLNGSIFHYDYQDFQAPLEQQDPSRNATFSGLTNMGDVETLGAELDLRWLPMEGLDLRAALGYLQTEIQSGPTGAAGETKSLYDILGNAVNVVGNELTNAPKLSANLLARYDFSLTSELGAAVQLGVNWQDDYYLSITNEPISKEDGRALVNARAEIYQEADTGWSVALWGKNLTDEVYRTSTGADGIGSRYSWYSAPRTYGATASYNF